MSKLLKEISYVLDTDKMTAVTGLEPDILIDIMSELFRHKYNIAYCYRIVTPALIPVTQKDNSFWYDRNLVDRFLFRDHINYKVYLPKKEAPLLICDLRKHLTFMVAPDGGRNANKNGRK